MIKESPKEKVFNVFNIILLLLLAIVFAYPFWYLFIISLNGGEDAIRGGIFLWPRVFTLSNYEYILNDNSTIRAFLVSVGRTVAGTVLGILFTSMVAFALSRKELPGKRFFTIIFLITMYFSGGLIPFYILLVDTHLINTFYVLIIPFLFSIWNMIIMRTSMRSLPESLIESAKIDGASFFRILFQIVIPLSMPVLAALSLFTAVGHWNDWFSGAYYITSDALRPLQTHLMMVLNGIGMQVTSTSAGQIEIGRAHV